MNVIGFEEAYSASMTILADTGLPVKVASPAGLMLLKIFAWEDRKYREPGKDAMDIRLLLTRYEPVAGRSLWDIEGLLEAEDYDADRAAARLLGRDIAAISSTRCRDLLFRILERELSADASEHLLDDLIRARQAPYLADEADYRQMRLLLASFRAGLND